MSLDDGCPHCSSCGSYGMTRPVLCEDCYTELSGAYAVLEAVLHVKTQKIDELHAQIIRQSVEIATLKSDLQAYRDDPFRAARELGAHDTKDYETWSAT